MGKVVAILAVGVLAWMVIQAVSSTRSSGEQVERRKRRNRTAGSDPGMLYYPSSSEDRGDSSDEQKGNDQSGDDDGDGDSDGGDAGDSGGDGGGDGGDGGD